MRDILTQVIFFFALNFLSADVLWLSSSIGLEGKQCMRVFRPAFGFQLPLWVESSPIGDAHAVNTSTSITSHYNQENVAITFSQVPHSLK
jgi:hypothetical protein